MTEIPRIFHSNPTNCPWGDKAFAGYLASPETEGPEHDASLLLPKTAVSSPKILLDYGTGDDFYKQGQLKPEVFEKAAKDSKCDGVQVRGHEGYDHSYCKFSVPALTVRAMTDRRRAMRRVARVCWWLGTGDMEARPHPTMADTSAWTIVFRQTLSPRSSMSTSLSTLSTSRLNLWM